MSQVDVPADPRVCAVLEVLAGDRLPDVAARWAVEPSLLRRWLAAFVDAGTARVTNRPEADEAHRRDRFLAAFAHEVRTPLTVAKGWTTMLADGGLAPELLHASVGKLDAALDALTERALDVELMAAASLGRLALSPRRVPLRELLDGLDGPGEPDAVADEGLTVTGDPVMLRRVLRDLWEAAGSAPRPERRWVEGRSVAPWTELRVVRRGDVIDPAVLHALFEPFDLNDDGTGVTLGLYLARALTVAHGGTLGVDQDEEGAVFWVKVPDHPPAGGES